jgi:putative DNA modification/repair radical SAM protein
VKFIKKLYILYFMQILEKIKILGESAKYDICASSASNRKIKSSTNNDSIGNVASSGICHSFGQDGRCISLYKTLMSNECAYDCKYCTNSNKCKKKATSFTPSELAKVFMSLYVKNYVEGLFLSSGVIKNPDETTEKMIETINLIRNKYKFNGYIHFKIIPGTSYELIKQASEFSDRLSINLEVPTKSYMSEISTTKDYKIDILRRQAWIKKMNLPSGQTTQFVVGSVNETDLDILKMLDWEYKNLNLKRGYFSAFIPVTNTNFENKNKTPLIREHRLYNIDFMLRKYNFKLDEFKSIMNNGMLPKIDPKLALAKQTITKPIEINTANYDELIRIPGIGPRSAYKIDLIRKKIKIKKYKQLHDIGIVLKRAKPFIKIDGTYEKSLLNY